MAVITTTTVSVRCAGHNGRATLKEAVEAGWRMCRICRSFVCPNCIQEFDMKMMGKCPSFIFGIEEHQLSPGPIPVEEVILFVESNKSEGITAGLLESLFFEDEQMSFMPFYAEVDNKKEEQEEDDELNLEAPKIQEEMWSSFGFVMTKRRRGKFITWEKIG
ncbi:MAG TPA: hypothetical protein VMX55_01960 [candidate division Zixibacteria bacterium]|nr:hypothetical protein [candidate division Zixibacteria bacterium]